MATNALTSNVPPEVLNRASALDALSDQRSKQAQVDFNSFAETALAEIDAAVQQSIAKPGLNRVTVRISKVDGRKLSKTEADLMAAAWNKLQDILCERNPGRPRWDAFGNTYSFGGPSESAVVINEPKGAYEQGLKSAPSSASQSSQFSPGWSDLK